MARMSYGGDLFSPIRFDDSFNDIFTTVRESDCFLDKWKKPVGLDESSESFKSNRESSLSTQKKSKTDTISTKISNDNLFEKNSAKISLGCSSPKTSHSFVTTRRKHSSRKKQSLPEADTSTNSLEKNRDLKNSNAVDNSVKYVTVRSGTLRSSELLAHNKIKQSSSTHTHTLPSLTEEPGSSATINSLKINPNALPKKLDSPSKTEAIENHYQQKTCAGIINEEKISDKLNVFHKNTPYENKKSMNEKLVSAVDCETQTDLLMSELEYVKTEKSSSYDHFSKTACLSNAESLDQPHQIQANILEKLVKNTVAIEFSGIRQMMFMQQLQLFRKIDKSAAVEQQNSADCDILLKVIEELVEENRRLKSIVNA